MRIQIDRSLPVPIAAQLQGQIEYGVSCGDLPPGSQLPSVRDLAAELGVSPVTVSQVYRTLQEKALIVTKAGRGTFVQEAENLPRRPGDSTSIHELIDKLIRLAGSQGLSRAELGRLVNVRLGRQDIAERAIRLVFVGVFEEVTRSYVADIKRHLHPGDTVEATTFAQLHRLAACREAARSADLVLTMPHRASEARELIGGEVQVMGISFIPSERTRAALAEVDPLAKVALISTFPEFLVTFKLGVRKFAPHVDKIRSAVLGTNDVAEVIRGSDVVVYATGSERIMDGLPGDIRAFEYRHVPDPRSIESVLLPKLGELRVASRLEPQTVNE